MRELIEIITAAFGTLGFSLVFGARRSHLLWLTIGGALSWAVYLVAAGLYASEPLRYFIAAAAVSIYSEIFARILKTPTVSILIPSILPLIPGGSLYYTMRYAIAKEWPLFMSNGALTLSIALAIALGIITVSTTVKLFFYGKRKNHK